MPEKIREYCRRTNQYVPETVGEVVRCIYESLALKYRMTVSFKNENYMVDGDYALSDILMVALVEGGVDETLTREQVIASIPENDWALIEDFSLSGDIQAKTNDETVGIVIWWAPSDSDDNFNVKNGKVTSDGADYLHIDMGITLVATQYTYEKDSFDEYYDTTAPYEETTNP
jgi:hypothetical protein